MVSRVSRTLSFTLAEDPAGCIDMLRQYLLKGGMKVRHEIDQEIEGYQGSQFITRVIGGWLPGPRTLPIWACIYCQPLPNGTTSVRLALEEALASEAIDDQLREHYNAGFRELLGGLDISHDRNTIGSLHAWALL